MVNTIVPYLLTKRLLPVVEERIVNLASAAQAPVSIGCLTGGLQGTPRFLSQSEAYAQSKMGILQWTTALAGGFQASQQAHSRRFRQSGLVD